jgi:uncharacterized cupin superfamily protein
MGKYADAPKPVRKEAARRDPCIANLDELEPEAYEVGGAAGTAWDLGAATGSKLVGVDVTEIPPGKNSSQFHSHSLKEEFFYVLSGRCVLRLGEGKHELRAGDAVSRPAGTGVAHQFQNPFAEPCRVLMLGVMGGKGLEDVADLPELRRQAVFAEDGTRTIVKLPLKK